MKRTKPLIENATHVATHLTRKTLHDIAIAYDSRLLWRRLFGEFIETFLLVLVAPGAGVMGTKYPSSVPVQSAAGAVGLIVLVLILAVGVAFLLRGPGCRDAQGPTLAQGDVEAVLRATKVISDTDSQIEKAMCE